MAYVKANIDLRGVQRKFNSSSIRRGQYALANQALADMNKFVPAKDYDLRNQTSVSLDGTQITYNAPYAAYQFYNQFNNYTTPGTGPRWDLKAKSLYINNWIEAFTRGAGI